MWETSLIQLCLWIHPCSCWQQWHGSHFLQRHEKECWAHSAVCFLRICVLEMKGNGKSSKALAAIASLPVCLLQWDGCREERGPQLAAGPSLPFCTPLAKDVGLTSQDRCARRNRMTGIISIHGFYEWYIGKSIKYQQESKYEACIVSVPSSQMGNSLCKRFSWPTFQAMLFALDQLSLKKKNNKS